MGDGTADEGALQPPVEDGVDQFRRGSRPQREINLGAGGGITGEQGRQAERRKGKPATDVFPGHGNRPADEAELDRLRRENAQLKEDVEILKKATAFFAKHDR